MEYFFSNLHFYGANVCLDFLAQRYWETHIVCVRSSKREYRNCWQKNRQWKSQLGKRRAIRRDYSQGALVNNMAQIFFWRNLSKNLVLFVGNIMRVLHAEDKQRKTEAEHYRYSKQQKRKWQKRNLSHFLREFFRNELLLDIVCLSHDRFLCFTSAWFLLDVVEIEKIDMRTRKKKDEKKKKKWPKVWKSRAKVATLDSHSRIIASKLTRDIYVVFNSRFDIYGLEESGLSVVQLVLSRMQTRNERRLA